MCLYGASAAAVDTGDTADTGSQDTGSTGDDTGSTGDDTATPDSGLNGEDIVLKSGGCTCSTSEEGGATGGLLGAMAGLGLMVAARRRR